MPDKTNTAINVSHGNSAVPFVVSVAESIKENKMLSESSISKNVSICALLHTMKSKLLIRSPPLAIENENLEK